MELLIESFPTEAAMDGRKTVLEGLGATVAYAGAAGAAKDMFVRVWDASGAAKTQVVDLANGFVLISTPG